MISSIKQKFGSFLPALPSLFGDSRLRGLWTAQLLPLFSLLALVSAFSFASRSIVAKNGVNGMPIATLMLFQSVMSLPLLATLTRAKKSRLVPTNVPWTLYAWRVFWGLVTTALTFEALKLMPTALASTLCFTAPLFMAVLSPIVLKESVALSTALLTVLGFLGVFINAVPYLNKVELWVMLIGLLAGAAGAFMQVHIRKLSSLGECGIRGVFWMHAVSAVVAGAICIKDGTLTLTWQQAMVCFTIAVLSCVAQITNASAYKHGKALPVNALSLLTLPLTVLMTATIFQEQISGLTVLGIAIVLPACFLLVMVERKRTETA